MAKITYTDKTTANTSPLPTTQKFTSGDANEIKESVNALYDAVIREYVAVLIQSGTDAPTATILKNTLGVVPVWTREYAGGYLATSAGAFPVAKTETVLSSCSADGEMILFDAQPQDNNVLIRNVTGVDESVFTIHISVYP